MSKKLYFQQEKEKRLTIRLRPQDNVAVAVHDLAAGTSIENGVVTREAIPQAHKIALSDIPAGGGIIRYGVALGRAKAFIRGRRQRTQAALQRSIRFPQ